MKVSIRCSLLLSQLVRFNQCDQIWRKLSTWQHFKSLAFLWGFIYNIGQNVEPTLVKYFYFWSYLMVLNGQRLKNNLAIWSHWFQFKKFSFKETFFLEKVFWVKTFCDLFNVLRQDSLKTFPDKFESAQPISYRGLVTT